MESPQRFLKEEDDEEVENEEAEGRYIFSRTGGKRTRGSGGNNALGGAYFEIITTNKIPPVKTLRTGRVASTHEHAAACRTSRPARGKQKQTCRSRGIKTGQVMMIAFITIKSGLVPLIEGRCAQIYFRFEIIGGFVFTSFRATTLWDPKGSVGELGVTPPHHFLPFLLGDLWNLCANRY